MKKGLLILLLTAVVIIFPSLTVAIKTSDDGSKRSLVDPTLEFDVVAACIECH